MANGFDDNDIRELQDMVRIGIVSSINKEKMTARVKIEEQGIVTGDLKVVQNLPCIVIEGEKVQTYPWTPFIGQWVLCMFIPGGEGDGFILGGV